MATGESSGESISESVVNREELFPEIIKGFLSSYRQKNDLKIIVIGEAGQGKSTLINGLVGKEVAKEGVGFDPGTEQIDYYQFVENGVTVKIWDTPGFGIGSPEEDEKMVEMLRLSDCYPHDIALFCVRMDTRRFPTRIHTETIKKFTEVFGRKFWEHTLFLLTFANIAIGLCPAGEDLPYYFSNRVCEFEDKIKETLQKYVHLGEDELEKVKAVPVGSHRKGINSDNPWELPDRQDWFVWFWIECTEHMHQASVPALLQVNHHRVAEVNTENPVAFDETADIPHKRKVHVPDLMDDVTKVSECEESISEVTNELVITTDDAKMYSEGMESAVGCENLSSRAIPVYSVLLQQLDKEDSSFSIYVKEFAKRWGKSVWILGHFAGSLHGIKLWLGKRSRMRKLN